MKQIYITEVYCKMLYNVMSIFERTKNIFGYNTVSNGWSDKMISGSAFAVKLSVCSYSFESTRYE